MVDNKQKVRQHEPLRVPQGWTDQARALAMQIERVFDKIFSLLGKHREDIKALNDAKANISGQVFTGHISVQKSSGTSEVYAKRTDSGLTVELLVGSNGVNHGLYSNGYVDSNNTFHSGSSWMVKRNEAGNVTVDFPYFTISANSNRTFTIGNNFRGTFYLVGTNSSNQEIYNVYSSSEGSVAFGKFGTSSAFTITTGTGTIKIANGAAYTTYVYVMVFNGTVS